MFSQKGTTVLFVREKVNNVDGPLTLEPWTESSITCVCLWLISLDVFHVKHTASLKVCQIYTIDSMLTMIIMFHFTIHVWHFQVEIGSLWDHEYKLEQM